MESYVHLEVPDTPDRLECAKVASSSTRQSMEHLDSYDHHHKRGRNSSSTISINPDETDLLFEQARLAKMVSENPKGNGSSKSFSIVQKPGQKEILTKNREKVEFYDLSDNSPISTTYPKKCSSFITKKGKEPVLEKNKLIGHNANSELLGAPRSSLPGAVAVLPRSRFKITNTEQDKTVLQDKTHARAMLTGKGKGTLLSSDMWPKYEPALSIISPAGAASKSKGQRRLVRNGCISPINIERNNNGISHSNGLASEQGKITLPNGINSDKLSPEKGSICSINLLSNSDIEFPCVLSSIPPNSSSRKGKAVIDDFAAIDRPIGKPVLKLGRPCTSSTTNVTTSGDVNDNTSASEDLGWKRMYSQNYVPPILMSNDSLTVHKTEEASYDQSDQSNIVGLGNRNHFNNRPEISYFHASNSSVEQPISLMNQERPIKETIKGKGKRKEMNHSHGESSSSPFDNSEILCLGTSWQPSRSNLRSRRTINRRGGGVTLGPIIEVDDLNSPGVTHEHPLEQNYAGSGSYGVEARQVESDELLARQLQEEFYNQSPASGSFEEIDAVIAQSLQHEENAQRASSASRQTQPTQRGRVAACFRRRQTSRSSLSSSSNHGRYQQQTEAAQFMRNVNFEGMDVGMRLNFLEELEYAFNNGRGRAVSRILQAQRGFNESDYETLLALDDNNHHHTGASRNWINSLPESVVQTDNIEEPCAVCLEKLSLGETIRHLPCLHKFHKDCIDEWLRRKTSCPVCKADIT